MSVRPQLVGLLVFLAPAVASAHIVVTAPTPRSDRANIKEPDAPCGAARGNVVTQLVGGQMFTLEYDETIAHPGYFQLRFSMANDANWQMIADNIADQGGVGSYSFQFQVPDVNCDDCTFQWIQVMEDRDPPTNYYSCFDVEIAPSDPGTPDAGMDAGVDAGLPDAGAIPPEDMGTTTTLPSNNNSGPTTDVGSGVVTPGPGPSGEADASGHHINATGTCASAGPHERSNGALALGLLFGLAALTRGGRRSSRGSNAAR